MNARQVLITVMEADRPEGAGYGAGPIKDEWNTAQQSARQHPHWGGIRHAVAQALVDEGAPEVGSSDINHGVMRFWRQYSGDWDQFLTDYGHDWKKFLATRR